MLGLSHSCKRTSGPEDEDDHFPLPREIALAHITLRLSTPLQGARHAPSSVHL